MAGKKKPVDFALDIYQMPEDQANLRDRLIKGWNEAIGSDNPVEGVYMLFRREGYDATYEECLKFIEAYKEIRQNPPWGQVGTLAY